IQQPLRDRDDLEGDPALAFGRAGLSGKRGLLIRRIGRTRVDATLWRLAGGLSERNGAEAHGKYCNHSFHARQLSSSVILLHHRAIGRTLAPRERPESVGAPSQ